MGKLKLRRTIYIGLGGTGIKTILKVKENFLRSCGCVPPMIKFLCIDTNLGDLNGKVVDVVKLDNTEKLHLTVAAPTASYNSGHNKGKYMWLPAQNQASLADIKGSGAGQVRSNGRFVFDFSEENGKSISSKLSAVYQDLAAAVTDDDNFDVMDTAKTDVFLAFSVAGGTGSGMFIRMASLIRNYIPNCNLIAYAYSHSFFENIGVTWNIKHNAFGALLELDYHMHGNRKEYINKSMGIKEKLFDAVMYIDNKTYTDERKIKDYYYKFDEVVENIGNALYLSAGQIGSETASIVDNLRTAMNSGGYDHDGKNGMKIGWMASVGVSELFCKDSADIEYKANQSAINLLNNLLKGDDTESNIKLLNAWIDDLDINESLGSEDNDKLINRILPPSAYSSPVSTDLINTNDFGVIAGDSLFKEQNKKKLDEVWVNGDVIVAEKETEFISKVRNTLFPKGSKTIGVGKLIDIITALKVDINSSKKKLNEEITNFESKSEECEKEKKEYVEIIRREKESIFPANARKVASAKDSIMKLVIEEFQIECEIMRRREAILMYDSLLKIITNYVGDEDGYGYLYLLKQHIESGIKTLEAEAVNKFKTSDTQTEPRSTSIDMTSLVNSLPTAQAELHPISDWSELFIDAKYDSVSDLSNKKDWSEFAKKEIKDNNAGDCPPIICRVLDTLTSEKRIDIFKKLIGRARPLMDVSTFGEIIKRDMFIFISLPNDIITEQFDTIKKEFVEAIGDARGIEFVKHRDGNKVLVYGQLGVIPPYYINGISSGKNGEQDITSCEYGYNDFLESGIHHSYTPFTDVFYKNAYEHEGHSLDSVHQSQILFTPLQMWVDSFILGVIERKGDLYRIQYVKGERDMSTSPIMSWKNLGDNHHIAYKTMIDSFANDPDFIKELTQRLKSLLANKQNVELRKQYYGADNGKADLYIDKLLMDRNSEEFQMAENQKLLNEELDYLRDN